MDPESYLTFVSKISMDENIVQNYGLQKILVAIKNCRNIGKDDMKYNNYMPEMIVDPEQYVSSSLEQFLRQLIRDVDSNGRWRALYSRTS